MYLKYTSLKSVVDTEKGFTVDYIISLQKKILTIIFESISEFKAVLNDTTGLFDCYINPDKIKILVVDAV